VPVRVRRRGVVVAKLVPAGEQEPRVFGTDEGIFTVPDDFDAPLADDVLESFER
jgi:antitoxin (DNA-binding transcriptional repressor) of toxin-antitoxin stability system